MEHSSRRANQVVTTEWNVWVNMILGVSYTGMIESGIGSDYGDPNLFFEFSPAAVMDPAGTMRISTAASTGRTRPVIPSPHERLAECEKRVLRAMPVLPLCFDVYTFLQKPYVRGQLGNSIDTPRFSDVSIDTAWRPQMRRRTSWR